MPVVHGRSRGPSNEERCTYLWLWRLRLLLYYQTSHSPDLKATVRRSPQREFIFYLEAKKSTSFGANNHSRQHDDAHTLPILLLLLDGNNPTWYILGTIIRGGAGGMLGACVVIPAKYYTLPSHSFTLIKGTMAHNCLQLSDSLCCCYGARWRACLIICEANKKLYKTIIK